MDDSKKTEDQSEEKRPNDGYARDRSGSVG
jgi:hypothetical protein